MIKRIAALIAIFLCTSAAWVVLGVTIFARTESPESDQLRSRVASSWGTAQTQTPPTASYLRVVEEKVGEEKKSWDEHGNPLVTGMTSSKVLKRTEVVPLALEGSKVDVSFDLKQRQKGLLWYRTYAVVFGGDYSFTNSSGQDQLVTFKVPFPSQEAIYDDLTMTVDNRPLTVKNESNSAAGALLVAAGKTVILHAAYRSQGLDSWRYNFGEGISQIHNLDLAMHTNFNDINFPEHSLSPTTKSETARGWDLTWNYKNLVSGYGIGMEMPEKLQPGPLAGKISFFAPVSLFFFFFLMFIITTVRGINLHPMNYFFLAAAFFAFHLLLAYLADHISIHLAFVICSAVSIFLVISYLRLVVGIRFAAIEAGGAQLIYLVLFSYAFFFKGFTGLAITIGSIVTLFVVMQMTGRINWEEKFARFKP